MSNRLVEIAEGDASLTIILAVGSILVAKLLGPSGYGVYSLTFGRSDASRLTHRFRYGLCRGEFAAKFKLERIRYVWRTASTYSQTGPRKLPALTSSTQAV